LSGGHALPRAVDILGSQWLLCQRDHKEAGFPGANMADLLLIETWSRAQAWTSGFLRIAMVSTAVIIPTRRFQSPVRPSPLLSNLLDVIQMTRETIRMTAVRANRSISPCACCLIVEKPALTPWVGMLHVLACGRLTTHA